jgi:hypothetical protein
LPVKDLALSFPGLTIKEKQDYENEEKRRKEIMMEEEEKLEKKKKELELQQKRDLFDSMNFDNKFYTNKYRKTLPFELMNDDEKLQYFKGKEKEKEFKWSNDFSPSESKAVYIYIYIYNIICIY